MQQARRRSRPSRHPNDRAARAERCRIAGLRTRLWRKGRGRAVLLLHGNGSFGAEILSPFPAVAGVEWIAPDRPGYGRSAPFAEGGEDPRAYARWAAALIRRLSPVPVLVVAHSLASGAALWLAAEHPDCMAGLVLLAPFCRPTPHRLIPGLRMAVAPVLGGPLRRRVLPALAPRLRHRILSALAAPSPVPPSLSRLSLGPALRSRSILTLAAELRAFNDGMAALDARRPLRLPVTAVFGLADATADPAWHGPWLAARVPGLRSVRLAGVGHAPHHTAPARVLAEVLALLPRRNPPAALAAGGIGWSAIQP